MPQRAKQVCGAPGCGALDCTAHAGRKAPADLGPRQPRLYDRRRWRDRLRRLVIARDSLCRIQVLCGRGVDRLPALSTEVDHIVPRSRGGDESMANLQGACKACHSHKTASDG